MKNDLTINFPVFRTKTEEESIPLIEVDRLGMVDLIINKAKSFNNSNSNLITLDNNGKTYINEVTNVNAIKIDINGSPAVLIQMTAKKANIKDAYVEIPDRDLITEKFKFGSDNYFFVMYPTTIKGRSKFRRYWNIFIYDDPNKESEEFIRIVKKVVKDIFGLSVSNLKRSDFVREMETYKFLENVTATFQTVESSDALYEGSFKDYIVEGKIFSKKEYKLHKMPIEKFIDLLNGNDDEITIKRKSFGINIGKKEYKIKCEVKKGYKKAKEKYSLLIESLLDRKSVV